MSDQSFQPVKNLPAQSGQAPASPESDGSDPPPETQHALVDGTVFEPRQTMADANLVAAIHMPSQDNAALTTSRQQPSERLQGLVRPPNQDPAPDAPAGVPQSEEAPVPAPGPDTQQFRATLDGIRARFRDAGLTLRPPRRNPRPASGLHAWDTQSRGAASLARIDDETRRWKHQDGDSWELRADKPRAWQRMRAYCSPRKVAVEVPRVRLPRVRTWVPAPEVGGVDKPSIWYFALDGASGVSYTSAAIVEALSSKGIMDPSARVLAGLGDFLGLLPDAYAFWSSRKDITAGKAMLAEYAKQQEQLRELETLVQSLVADFAELRRGIDARLDSLEPEPAPDDGPPSSPAEQRHVLQDLRREVDQLEQLLMDARNDLFRVVEADKILDEFGKNVVRDAASMRRYALASTTGMAVSLGASWTSAGLQQAGTLSTHALLAAQTSLAGAIGVTGALTLPFQIKNAKTYGQGYKLDRHVRAEARAALQDFASRGSETENPLLKNYAKLAIGQTAPLMKGTAAYMFAAGSILSTLYVVWGVANFVAVLGGGAAVATLLSAAFVPIGIATAAIGLSFLAYMMYRAYAQHRAVSSLRAVVRGYDTDLAQRFRQSAAARLDNRAIVHRALQKLRPAYETAVADARAGNLTDDALDLLCDDARATMEDLGLDPAEARRHATYMQTRLHELQQRNHDSRRPSAADRAGTSAEIEPDLVSEASDIGDDEDSFDAMAEVLYRHARNHGKIGSWRAGLQPGSRFQGERAEAWLHEWREQIAREMVEDRALAADSATSRLIEDYQLAPELWAELFSNEMSRTKVGYALDALADGHAARHGGDDPAARRVGRATFLNRIQLHGARVHLDRVCAEHRALDLSAKELTDEVVSLLGQFGMREKDARAIAEKAWTAGAHELRGPAHQLESFRAALDAPLVQAAKDQADRGHVVQSANLSDPVIDMAHAMLARGESFAGSELDRILNPAGEPNRVDLDARFGQLAVREDGGMTVTRAMADIVLARLWRDAHVTEARLAAADKLMKRDPQFATSIFLDELQAVALERTQDDAAPGVVPDQAPAAAAAQTDSNERLPDTQAVRLLRRFGMTDRSILECHHARFGKARDAAIAMINRNLGLT